MPSSNHYFEYLIFKCAKALRRMFRPQIYNIPLKKPCNGIHIDISQRLKCKKKPFRKNQNQELFVVHSTAIDFRKVLDNRGIG